MHTSTPLFAVVAAEATATASTMAHDMPAWIIALNALAVGLSAVAAAVARSNRLKRERAKRRRKPYKKGGEIL